MVILLPPDCIKHVVNGRRRASHEQLCPSTAVDGSEMLIPLPSVRSEHFTTNERRKSDVSIHTDTLSNQPWAKSHTITLFGLSITIKQNQKRDSRHSIVLSSLLLYIFEVYFAYEIFQNQFIIIKHDWGWGRMTHLPVRSLRLNFIFVFVYSSTINSIYVNGLGNYYLLFCFSSDFVVVGSECCDVVFFFQ